MRENILRNFKGASSERLGGSRRRIAIFQYKLDLSSYTKELILRLAGDGYTVEVFTANKYFYNNQAALERLKGESNIVIHNIETKAQFFLFKFLRIVRLIVFAIIKRVPVMRKVCKQKYRVVGDEYYKCSEKLIEEHKLDYLCFIGIEKKGLVWAGKLSEATGIPFIYYSLELYLEGHPRYNEFKRDREQEIFYHQRARATIIQDELRANVLFKCNRIKQQDKILFPISVSGKPHKVNSNYLREKYRLPRETKILLYFGGIEKTRDCSLIANVLERSMNGFVVIFHGPGKRDYLEELAKKKNVIVSSKLVPDEQIGDIILSADIGLALYPNTNSNYRLTAFSSERVALYLRYGIPIITMNNESYRKLFSKYRCGEMIDTYDELPKAADKIMTNVKAYKNLANMAYEEFYNFDKNVKVIINYLESF